MRCPLFCKKGYCGLIKHKVWEKALRSNRKSGLTAESAEYFPGKERKMRLL